MEPQISDPKLYKPKKTPAMKLYEKIWIFIQLVPAAVLMFGQYLVSGFGVRHCQLVMLFTALTLNLSMRATMSLAIVDMTDSTKDEYYEWSIKKQSVILSSFFWGYVVLQVPAGEMASKYGGKILLLICVAGNTVIMTLIPTAAYYGGWQTICACRIIQGLLQGWMLPTIHGLMAKWVPLPEKSTMGAFVYSGNSFGLAFQLLISGFIAHAWGWQAIFYISAAMGLTWTVLYYIFGANCPESSRFISIDEKEYIQQSLGQRPGKQIKVPTPWKALWSCPGFISILVAHIGFSWGMWTLMTEIPTYISKVLNVNIKDNGIISASPYLTMTFMAAPFAFLSDFLLKNNRMSLSNSRKTCNTIAFFGAAIALIALSHAGTNTSVVITLLCLAVGMSAGHITGFMLVHLDMAPNFAGTMMGITNGVSSFLAIMGPIATGFMLKDETNPSEWRKLFYLTAGLYIVTNLAFIIFGTSERQPWNEPKDSNLYKDQST